MAFYRCGWLLDRGDAPQCPTNMAKLTLTVSKSTSLAYQGCSKKPSKSKCLGCPDWREPSADARLQCRQKHHALQRQVKECQKGFSPRCDFQGCVVPGGKLPPLHSLDWQYIYIYIYNSLSWALWRCMASRPTQGSAHVLEAKRTEHRHPLIEHLVELIWSLVEPLVEKTTPGPMVCEDSKGSVFPSGGFIP